MAIKITINKNQLACPEATQDIEEEKKPGLWANIHAKRKRGEPPASPGDKDYPKTLDIDEEKLVEAIMEKLSDILEAKPAKGKRFAKKVKGKGGRTRTVSYGQSGKAKGGGDRISPGTKKGDAYCARSAKIKKCKNPPCPNDLSRKKWKCRGSKSMK
jgi:hypothetical protein